ncbi:hypothetical protein G114_05075 [Aeromonas diversa CDC 2478-85]|uniref:Uncharacterized protein n=1 Tax=Aeromonas diversa CDC 2478-85 TaxID=1268237 RepID=N9VCH2_9GAMM|nr:hypothetical protein [Aeromonas diversa]ENY72942.1 hypothetical protein G114_05075 [Aeromonas diversa CDC 2478-85]
MLANRLPTSLIARLMLVLLLACNLTFCLAAHQASAAVDQMALSCHAEESQPSSDCPMPSGLAGSLAQLAAGLPWLLLPLLLCLSLFAPPLLLAARSGWRVGRERGPRRPPGQGDTWSSASCAIDFSLAVSAAGLVPACLRFRARE